MERFPVDRLGAPLRVRFGSAGPDAGVTAASAGHRRNRTVRPMLDFKRPNQRHFTDAARAAAKEARRRKKEMQADPNRPEIFVARASPESRSFIWEIRRFGGVLLHRGSESYDNVPEARSAGKRALDAFNAAR